MQTTIESLSNRELALYNCTLTLEGSIEMENIKQFFKDNKAKLKNLGVTFNPPCTDEDLADMEKLLTYPLPPDLIEFYKFCNGFETNDYMFRVVPVSEAVDYRIEVKDNTFHFAEYMIYSDEWLIQLNNAGGYEIINNDHGTEEMSVQTNSIFKFITLYLAAGLFGTVENDNFYDRLNKNKPLSI